MPNFRDPNYWFEQARIAEEKKKQQRDMEDTVSDQVSLALKSILERLSAMEQRIEALESRRA